MRTKKGLGHVEVIISFVLFVGFLVVLFVLFNPFESSQHTGIADSVLVNLEEDLLREINSVSLSFGGDDVEDGKSCVSIGFDEIAEDMKCNSGNVLVKDRTGKVNSYYSGNDLEIELSGEDADTGKYFYTIYCSEEIESSGSDLGDCGNNLVLTKDNLGIITMREAWSEKLILNFIGQDYESIKSDYVLGGNEFSFEVYTLNDVLKSEYSLDNEIPEGVEVVAKTTPIKILNKDAEIKQHKMVVKTW